MPVIWSHLLFKLTLSSATILNVRTISNGIVLVAASLPHSRKYSDGNFADFAFTFSLTMLVSNTFPNIQISRLPRTYILLYFWHFSREKKFEARKNCSVSSRQKIRFYGTMGWIIMKRKRWPSQHLRSMKYVPFSKRTIWMWGIHHGCACLTYSLYTETSSKLSQNFYGFFS